MPPLTPKTAQLLSAISVGIVTVNLLVGCAKPIDSDAPISPANSFALTQDQLKESTSAAEKGDVEAMTRLSSYYLLNQRGDLKGWYWLEKAAEAGDLAARISILNYYSSESSKEMKTRGLALKQKWAM